MWLVYYTPVGNSALHFDMAFSDYEMLASARKHLLSSTTNLHHVMGRAGQTMTAEHVAVLFAGEANA